MRAAAKPTRYEERKHIADPMLRIFMLENDADESDRVNEMILAKIDTNTRVLIGLLITIAGAAVIGALNLIFQAV